MCVQPEKMNSETLRIKDGPYKHMKSEDIYLSNILFGQKHIN